MEKAGSEPRPKAELLIGALIDSGEAPAMVAALLPMGFESFQLSFWDSVGSVDLPALADELRSAVEGSGAVMSAIGVYGNTLDPAGRTRASLEALIEEAPAFGARIVSCFAGRVPGASVPDSIAAWKEAFGPLSEKAAARGLTLALENCRLGDTWKGGKWNIAINPDAWELLFDALPGAPIGLEWEPSHQILAFADPLAQLEAWADKVVHVHGKDAVLDRTALALRGAYGSTKAGREALPGFGDADWEDLISVLLRKGYAGSVDIELPADSEYRHGREIQGFAAALGALKKARGSAPSAK
jgi:sugar phosphate isomerase/epimerase